MIPASVVKANSGPVAFHGGIGEWPDEVWTDFVAQQRDRQNPDKPATYATRLRDRARQDAARPDPAREDV